MSDFPDLSRFTHFAIDVEATGRVWHRDTMFSISITTPDRVSYYWDLRDRPDALQWAKKELPKARHWIAHNAKYEFHMLREAGIHMNPAAVECTMIREALLDEHMLSYDLDSVGHRETGIGKDETIWQELADLFGGKPTKDAQIGNLPKAPPKLVGRYANRDSLLALQVWEVQNKKLHEQDLMRVYEVEKRLLPVLVDLEHRGVRVDIDRAEKAVSQIDKEAKLTQQHLNELAGFPVNPNPSGSIHKLFAPKWNGRVWVANDGTLLGKTDSGAASLNADALRAMKHPAAAMILELRQLIKLRDTFLLGHVLGHHKNGTVHANFNQTRSENDKGTGTGRLSVNGPALQQIHKRNAKTAAIIRACFVPDDGQEWNCRDWSQMDFRVFAHYVNEERMNEAYAKDPDTDFHQMVADATGLPRKPTPGRKGNAKQINLGLVFGMGQGKLAHEMGLPFTIEVGDNGREYMKAGPEAEAVFDQYHRSVPGVRKFLRHASSIAKERGYVKTIMGRRIRFPGGQFTHKAGGLVFQGSAAEALKVKICEVHDFLKGTDGRLMLNVHDEFDSSLPTGDTKLDAGIKEIVECFDGVKTPIKFRIPIRSSVGKGPNWWEASKE